MRVEKDYRFTAEDGEASLRDLFGGRSQLLVVYHFMFDPDWDEDCPSYSGVTDGFAGSGPHFEHHDVAFVVVSRAPLDKLVAYKRRMGWDLRWVSSLGSSFNYDFHVTIDPAVAPVEHNYKDQAQLEAANVAWRDWSGEQPGMSAFARDGDDVFHTYSAYSRGFDGCGRWGSGWTLCRWAAMKATGGPIAEPAHRQLDRRSRSPNISCSRERGDGAGANRGTADGGTAGRRAAARRDQAEVGRQDRRLRCRGPPLRLRPTAEGRAVGGNGADSERRAAGDRRHYERDPAAPAGHDRCRRPGGHRRRSGARADEP